MQDYLGLEEPLQAKLQTLASGLQVRPLADLGDVKSRMQLAPAVFVGFAGDRRAEDVPETIQQWVQQWWTVIAVRAAGGGHTGQKLRAAAGPALTEVINALGGWTPDRKQWRPLSRVAAGQPSYYIGYAEFPLLWETRISIPIAPQT